MADTSAEGGGGGGVNIEMKLGKKSTMKLETRVLLTRNRKKAYCNGARNRATSCIIF